MQRRGWFSADAAVGKTGEELVKAFSRERLCPQAQYCFGEPLVALTEGKRQIPLYMLGLHGY